MAGSFDPVKYMEKMRIFIKNRQAVPLEELDKYAGQWIAWSPDGTHVVAGAEDLDDVYKAVVAAGYDPQECVFGPADYDPSI
jgi:hypothetical protein